MSGSGLQVNNLFSPKELKVNFDESQMSDGSTGHKKVTKTNGITISADNFLLRNESIDFHKKEKGYLKRIHELELELAL